ncbi:MAG: hypothetical protein ACMUJM_24900 [bacterium]
MVDVPVPSGGEAQIWIKIIWQEKSFDKAIPVDDLPDSKKLLSAMSCAFICNFFLDSTLDFTKDVILGRTAAIDRGPIERGSKNEKTLARKAALISLRIWQKAKYLLPEKQMTSQPSVSGNRIPVRLGASAPKIANPGASFLARFVAYHPVLEAELDKQLNQLDPEVAHRRTNWELGTRVKVKVYGEKLVVDPEEDEFQWGGEKHILDFRVNVDKNTIGLRDLKFDVYVESYRLCRIWMPLEVSNQPTDKVQSKTVSSPRTAFASYALEDRLRVLDRVATLKIHCGLRVFLDCISMRPNAKWRELLPDMVLESDQLLLFWFQAARDSRWVDKE